MKTLADLLLARDLAELKINTAIKNFMVEANKCLDDGVHIDEVSFETISVLQHGYVGRGVNQLLLPGSFKIKVTS